MVFRENINCFFVLEFGLSPLEMSQCCFPQGGRTCILLFVSARRVWDVMFTFPPLDEFGLSCRFPQGGKACICIVCCCSMSSEHRSVFHWEEILPFVLFVSAWRVCYVASNVRLLDKSWNITSLLQGETTLASNWAHPWNRNSFPIILIKDMCEKLRQTLVLEIPCN